MDAVQSTSTDHGFRERASTAVGHVRERMAGAVDSTRARVGSLQAQLADAMDSSAHVLRERAASLSQADTAGRTTSGSGTVVDAPQFVEQGELVAGVLEGGATWLRENDLGEMEARLMQQLRTHPARTLGVAAALGFLIARRRA